MLVRDASDDDVTATLEIYNRLVAETTVIWQDEPETPAGRQAWARARRARGFPVLVAVGAETGTVVGLGSYADFRDSVSKPGYRFTVEHTIHVREGWRDRGIGPLLLDALIERARAAGIHVMVAGVDGANKGSIRFHERHGFVETARMPEVGWKFGRWLDLVLLQRFIDEPGAPR
jgi:L-amino acid N-acyltransferase